MSPPIAADSPQLDTEFLQTLHRYDVIHGNEKALVDALPQTDAETLRKSFSETEFDSEAVAQDFFNTHFDLPEQSETALPHESGIDAHITSLWDSLRQTDDTPTSGLTRIPLPHPYIRAGGRFNELYYWDTYFTALGLLADDRIGDIEDLIDNFAWLITTYGHIPNGSRTYYLSRSQPPFFYKLLQLYEHRTRFKNVEPYLPQLHAEHRYWMERSTDTDRQDLPTGHLVSNNDHVLNRYWDTGDTPRAEMYQTDASFTEDLDEQARRDVFINRRSTCESGWDFSSRWRQDPHDPLTNHMTDLAPVDLNALLYELESQLSDWFDQAGREAPSAQYADLARARRDTLNTVHWDADEGFYVDYNWKQDTTESQVTIAGITPLFTGAATQEQADQVAEYIQTHFLEAGGVPTTLVESGEQWDYPNGWAPHQWMASEGLRRYGHHDLAVEIEDRWCTTVEDYYDKTGRLIEKYDVTKGESSPTDGEYDAQDGFGWTNGVYRAFKKLNRQ